MPSAREWGRTATMACLSRTHALVAAFSVREEIQRSTALGLALRAREERQAQGGALVHTLGNIPAIALWQYFVGVFLFFFFSLILYKVYPFRVVSL